MSRSVALCWELGGGLGHVTRLRVFMRLFRDRGFRVYVIARNLASAGQVFRSDEARLLQAPFRHGSSLQFRTTFTLAHILHNVGHGDAPAVAALTGGWRTLFEMIRPELIVADHSPTALLAAQTMGLPSVICGSGFFCPPDESPLPHLLPASGDQALQFAAVEDRVLSHLNDVLCMFGGMPLERVTELYGRAESRILLTFGELDHYGHRRAERYWGYWPFQPGIPPAWADGRGPRIFAYLKPCPQLHTLLAGIASLKMPTLIVVADLDPALRRQFESATLRFSERIIDLRCLDPEKDIAITNANLGAVTALLLSGIPQLSIPLHVEQFLVAQSVQQLGAGVFVLPNNTSNVGQALTQLMSHSKYQQSARQFADRYADFDPDSQFRELGGEMDKALPQSL